MGKIKTYRTKHNNVWISIYLEDHGFGWNLGLNIYKSKRAQNDWYQRRRNRRAQRAAQLHNVADLRCWAACASLMRLVLDTHNETIFLYLAARNRKPLARYLTRWGFVETDGFWIRLKPAA